MASSIPSIEGGTSRRAVQNPRCVRPSHVRPVRSLTRAAAGRFSLACEPLASSSCPPRLAERTSWRGSARSSRASGARAEHGTRMRRGLPPSRLPARCGPLLARASARSPSRRGAFLHLLGLQIGWWVGGYWLHAYNNLERCRGL